MRLVRPVIAGLLGLTVATLAGEPAASAATAQSLTVTPNHGPSTAPFTIAYQESVRLLPGSCASSVTFTFDGAVLGDAPVARKGSACVASLSTNPTPGSGPGPHTVRAAGTSVSATYTIDAAPSPAPPSPAHASPTPTRAVPSASPSDASDALPAVPSATDTAAGTGYDPPDAGAPVTMAGSGGSGGISTTTWVLGGGALLIIADVAILALLSLRGRRGERGRALPGG